MKRKTIKKHKTSIANCKKSKNTQGVVKNVLVRSGHTVSKLLKMPWKSFRTNKKGSWFSLCVSLLDGKYLLTLKNVYQ